MKETPEGVEIYEIGGTGYMGID
jgi:hypothetical protein